MTELLEQIKAYIDYVEVFIKATYRRLDIIEKHLLDLEKRLKQLER